MRKQRTEQVLELQVGLRSVVARLQAQDAFVRALVPGSRLEVTGVDSGLGGDRAVGRDIDSFELFPASPADLRVLARPPWWTFPRLLAALGVVILVLLAAMLWALSLRRQVAAQTRVIRQKAQREAALEERARIAKDIHDELGSSLTRIMLLGERVQEDIAKPDELAAHARRIVSSARATVQSMDEIVWAVDPKKDTLNALVGYINQYANEFFEGGGIRCRPEMPIELASPGHSSRGSARSVSDAQGGSEQRCETFPGLGGAAGSPGKGRGPDH